MITGSGLINFYLDSSASVSVFTLPFPFQLFWDLTGVLSLIKTPSVSLASDSKNSGVDRKNLVIRQAYHIELR